MFCYIPFPDRNGVEEPTNSEGAIFATRKQQYCEADHRLKSGNLLQFLHSLRRLVFKQGDNC
jgi:hypothetical protein